MQTNRLYSFPMMNNLDKAIKHFGSKVKMARSLDVSPMVVYQWSVRKVPVERALQIEKVTNGDIKASDLRPDIF